MEQLTVVEAITRLDAIQPGDNQQAHSEADQILYEAAPAEVQAAYDRAYERSKPWWYV